VMIEIEKGIPIPEGREFLSKYNWKKMEVGDSFFVPKTGTSTMRNLQNNLSILSRRAGKKSGAKFKTAMREETIKNRVVKGVRVWRIA
jgi:hypothetical protein